MIKYIVTIFNFKTGEIYAEYHVKSSNPAKAISSCLVNHRFDKQIQRMTTDCVVQAQLEIDAQ